MSWQPIFNLAIGILAVVIGSSIIDWLNLKRGNKAKTRNHYAISSRSFLASVVASLIAGFLLSYIPQITSGRDYGPCTRITPPVLFREDFTRNLQTLYDQAVDRGIAAAGFSWGPLSTDGSMTIEELGKNNWALRFHRDITADPATTTGLEIPIRGEVLKGKLIEIRALVKYENIVSGKPYYKSGQLNLFYRVPHDNQPADSVWEAVQMMSGTSDGWQNVAAKPDSLYRAGKATPSVMAVDISRNADNHMNLTIGLQQCTGTLWFDHIEIVHISM